MSEEKNPNALTKIREWVSAHPIITGVVVGSTIAIACQVIAARVADRAELTDGDAETLTIEGDVAE
ncbi:MAG: hypothetical protein HXO58_08110 [Rothia mucilaginosa]|uniref:Uncharacterized protein n=1 Tax=Rothia mucilaginosa TaxID=43675 RepID=A0A930LB65_9MICC|nr:hypothetical protein [Rothia mucilaginosa]MBF1659782.1 hypothetical protein [Rothia mucilaginosa]